MENALAMWNKKETDQSDSGLVYPTPKKNAIHQKQWHSTNQNQTKHILRPVCLHTNCVY